MLHRFPTKTLFEGRMQIDHFDYLCSSDHAQASLAEQFVRNSIRTGLSPTRTSALCGVADMAHSARCEHACRFGCEGIVSKRLGSPYRSGRTDHWIKVKNPRPPQSNARLKRIGAPSDWCVGGVPEMMHFSHFTPLFQFALLLVVPGALAILLVALLRTRL
jgi:hypothetical protein